MMIACVCHRVSDGDIAHAMHAGGASLDELPGEVNMNRVRERARPMAEGA